MMNGLGQAREIEKIRNGLADGLMGGGRLANHHQGDGVASGFCSAVSARGLLR